MSVSGTAAIVDLTGRSDARLVALVRAGEDEAFEELYRRYQRRIRGFIANRVGDSSGAEELTQEAFMSALRGLRASETPISWKPWLYEIARNATIDFHRRRRNTEVLSVEQEEHMRPLDRRRLVAGRQPDAVLDEKERFEHLRGAFDELPRNHHRVLVLRELEGLSYSEIADRLDMTHSAVESKLFRARRRLEREFDELTSGRRCMSTRATVAMMAEGVGSRADRRRVARHARHCSACRRHARELGVDPFGRRPWQDRAAALLPLGWLLRRGPASQTGEAMLFGGGQLGAGLAERTAALVAAGALACAGTLTMGGGTKHDSHPAPEPVSTHVVAPSVPSGVEGARVRGRSAAAEPSDRHGERWQRSARHKRRIKAHRDQLSPRPAPPQAAPAPATAAPQAAADGTSNSLPTATVIHQKLGKPVVADRMVKPPVALPQLPQRLAVLDALRQSLHE